MDISIWEVLINLGITILGTGLGAWAAIGIARWQQAQSDARQETQEIVLLDLVLNRVSMELQQAKNIAAEVITRFEAESEGYKLMQWGAVLENRLGNHARLHFLNSGLEKHLTISEDQLLIKAYQSIDELSWAVSEYSITFSGMTSDQYRTKVIDKARTLESATKKAIDAIQPSHYA